MTVLGRGDLSPPRRYGRRRRWPRVLLVLIILAALGAAGYYGWHRWRDDKATVATAPTPCPTPSPTPTPPPLASTRVAVLNASLKPGLAARAARDLRRRFGVNVTRVGNAAGFDKGPSVLRYPPALAAQAQRLAAMVFPAPRLRGAAGQSRLELDLGTAFRGVVTTAEYERATAASPTPTPTPSPTPSTCTSP